MSFYGNLKRVNSSPFIFDRYYPSRKAMDEAAATDGVYVGRYVLVRYDYEIKDEKIIYSDRYEPKFLEASELTEDLYESGKFFIKNENNLYVLCTDDNYDSSKRYYRRVRAITENYQNSMREDFERYNDTFDATIWQKIYTKVTDNINNSSNQAEEKYILIAELNADAPRLTLNPIAPKYATMGENGTLIEHWVEPNVTADASSDAFIISMPDILHLDIGDMNRDFYGRALIENPAEKHVYPNMTHDEALLPEHNYMRWENTYKDEIVNEPGPIDGKKLDTEFYAFGQVVSDLYDILYGAPKDSDEGLRPFYTEDLKDVIGNYDRGLVGILSSIATDAKGDLAEDTYGRGLRKGYYYYFTSKWGDASEDSTCFIENIPNVIGATTANNGGPAFSQYFINFNATSTSGVPSYIQKWTS